MHFQVCWFCDSFVSVLYTIYILDVTFAHFGSSPCLGDYAVATSGMNDDLQHPVESEGILFDDVEENYKIIYHRPNTK